MSETMARYNDAAMRPGFYVSGFDPRQFLRLNTNEEGRKEWSLDTALKKLWFRMIYPNGRIDTSVLEKDERHIFINARVYADRMDPPENFLAEGKAERFAPVDPSSAKPYEVYFCDWAETVAIGRALTNAGFDLPFVNVLENGVLLNPMTGEVVDGPEPPAPAAAAPQTAPRPYSNLTAPPAQQTAAQQQAPRRITPAVQQPPVNPAGNPQAAPNWPQQPAEPRNEAEALQMPLEWAKKVPVSVGYYQGRRMEEVAMMGRDKLEWFLTGYKGNDFKLRAAAKILINHAMAQAG